MSGPGQIFTTLTLSSARRIHVTSACCFGFCVIWNLSLHSFEYEFGLTGLGVLLRETVSGTGKA